MFYSDIPIDSLTFFLPINTDVISKFPLAIVKLFIMFSYAIWSKICMLLHYCSQKTKMIFIER